MVIDPELKTARPDIVKLYEDETGWVISPDNFPIKAELLAPQPAETSEDSKVFTWSARLNVDASASVFYADTKESRPLAEVLRLQSGEIQLQVAYVEGKWRSETAVMSVGLSGFVRGFRVFFFSILEPSSLTKYHSLFE